MENTGFPRWRDGVVGRGLLKVHVCIIDTITSEYFVRGFKTMGKN